VSGQLHDPTELIDGYEPWKPLHRRLGGPQSRYGRLGEDRQLFPLPETERRFIGCAARSLVTRGL